MIRVSRINMKRIIAVFLSVIMIIATCSGTYGFRAFAEGGTDTTSDTFKQIMKNEVPAGYVEGDLKNPYSNNKNKFTIVEDDELLLFRSFNVNNTEKDEIKNIGTSTYNKFKNQTGDSMKICDGLTSSKGGWDSYTDTVYDKGVKDEVDYAHGLAFSQSVAFDPDGSGYKDHVAYVGFDGGGGVYTWIYDATKDTYGPMRWVGSSNSIKDLTYHDSRKYLSITAGDYNDDGKDTFVIYFPGKGDTYKLLEYSASSADNLTNIDWNRSDLHPAYNKQTSLKNSESWGDKLACDLTTGDFDGDGVDDLGVISYVQAPSTSDLSTNSPELYIPYVTAAFGGSDVQSGTIMDSQVKQNIYAKLKEQKSDNDTNVLQCDTLQ